MFKKNNKQNPKKEDNLVSDRKPVSYYTIREDGPGFAIFCITTGQQEQRVTEPEVWAIAFASFEKLLRKQNGL